MKYELILSCGHKRTMEFAGPGKERDRKIRYSERLAICEGCHQEREAKIHGKSLIFRATVLPFISLEGDILAYIWIEGNTLGNREKIKRIGGYSWGYRSRHSVLPQWGSPEMCWSKTVKLNSLQDEIQKASDEIDDIIYLPDKDMFTSRNYQIASEKKENWEANEREIAGLYKPATPEVIRGYKWNKKVYGKKGRYLIYLDEEPTPISDEEAEEIRRYAEDIYEYEKQLRRMRTHCTMAR